MKPEDLEKEIEEHAEDVRAFIFVCFAVPMLLILYGVVTAFAP